jgi:tripartite ATP-independent transporter DctP family solute receptor
MLKKRFSKVLLTSLMVLVLLILAACGGSEDASSEDTDSGDSSSGDTVTLQIPHVVPEDHASHLAWEEFKEQVEEESDGRIEVEIYANSSLYGSEREIIEATQLGNVEISGAGTPSLAGFAPEFMVADLPFIFKTREAAHAAFDGELGDILNEKLEEVGLIGYGVGENGYRHLLNNEGPITEPGDLEGMKIRVMENQLYQDMFNILGADASPLAFGELYSAMQQGTYDAMDNPPSLVYTNNFYEVQNYMSLTGHVYAGVQLFANKEFMDGLPEDLRTIIEDGLDNYVTRHRELAYEQDTEYLDELEELGLEINEVTDEQKDVFLEEMQPIYEEYEDIVGKDLIDLAQSYNE